jgi:chemotaxis protein CheX
MPLDYLNEETIVDLTSQLFSALLADGDAIMATAAGADRLRSADTLIATVDITGTPPARVEVACSLPLARAVAAAMFATTEHALDESAVLDAVGELVNIIGGNVKALFDGEAGLSLPALRIESGLPECPTGSACAATFLWRDEPLAVRVTETEAAVA